MSARRKFDRAAVAAAYNATHANPRGEAEAAAFGRAVLSHPDWIADVRHLTAEDVAVLAEGGTGPTGAFAHLAQCEECEDAVSDVRRTLEWGERCREALATLLRRGGSA